MEYFCVRTTRDVEILLYFEHGKDTWTLFGFKMLPRLAHVYQEGNKNHLEV